MLKALPCHSASKKVSRFLVDSLRFRLPFDDVVFFAPYLGLLLTVLLTLLDQKVGLFSDSGAFGIQKKLVKVGRDEAFGIGNLSSLQK